MTFEQFWQEQAAWSQKAFGSDQERGPLGPLKHLEKESKEAQKEAEIHPQPSGLYEEIVDCFFLVIDAARRAGISSPEALLLCAQFKLEKNKRRTWSQPVKDEAVEHVREEG